MVILRKKNNIYENLFMFFDLNLKYPLEIVILEKNTDGIKTVILLFLLIELN
jgi:hypothetical protein